LPLSSLREERGGVAAADKALAIADEATKIVPGHGPVMTKADLQPWRDRLAKLQERVADLAAKKKTLGSPPSTTPSTRA
jgi:hypothetical protein